MKKIGVSQRITIRESESFKKYLQDIRQIPAFTPDEEYKVSLLAAEGDENAIHELVTRNLRFVVTVAKQYVTETNSLEDLVNEGNYGLMTAAQRFDPTRGLKFITYGVWWIRKGIIDYLAMNGRSIRLPNNKLSLISKIRKEYDRIEQILERTPNLNEVVEMTEGKFDEDDILFFMESEREGMLSMDTPMGEDNSSGTRGDFFEDTTFGATDSELDLADGQRNVITLLGKLKCEKEKKVLTLLFGLDGNEQLSLKDVGEIMGISRERVRQIRDKSLKYLARLLK